MTLRWFRQLVGEWYRRGEDGEATDELISRIRVTAGGSAVVEELFPGKPHEMLTVYFMDGKRLMLTHYCVAGNAPQMKAKLGKKEGVIEFECVGVANLAHKDAKHMNHARFELIGPNRLRTAWTMVEKGKAIYSPAFDLVRRIAKK